MPGKAIVRRVEETALVCEKFPLEIQKPILFSRLWKSHPSIVHVFAASTILHACSAQTLCEGIADVTIGARGDFLENPLLELSLRLFSALL